MHDHFEKGDSGYVNSLEVTRVFPPWLFLCDGLLLCLVVAIEGIAVRIDQLDGVFKLLYLSAFDRDKGQVSLPQAFCAVSMMTVIHRMPNELMTLVKAGGTLLRMCRMEFRRSGRI